MKKLFNLLLICALISGFTACSDVESEKKNAPSSTVTFTLSAINKVQEVAYSSGSVTYKNSTTAIQKTEEVTILNNQFILTMPQGLYTISFEGKGTHNVDGETVPGTFKAQLAPATVTGAACSLTLAPFLLNEEAGFVIEEIFYAGTVYPGTGKAYIGDQYFKITNNSEKVLFAGGLALVETKFNSSSKHDYKPNMMSEAITIDAIYAIPGNENDYPIEPGKSIILCDKAINHKKEAHDQSFDLSQADFEWYDKLDKPMDTDNPSVPNLDKIYSYSLTLWVPSKIGNTAFALVDFRNRKDGFLEEKLYTYTYIFVNPTNGDEKTISSTAYQIPNEWVIDAVQLATPDKWQWNVVDPSLDAGYTYCGTTSNDKKKYGKSVRRKAIYVTEDGRKILQDTNNSADDFERDAVPSATSE